MKTKKFSKPTILVVLTSAVILVLVGISIFLFTKKDASHFNLQVNDRIYFEYDVDYDNPVTINNKIFKNITETDSLELTFEYNFSTETKSFNYYSRAQRLDWDKEGKEIVPGFTSVGAVTSFYYTVEGNDAAFDALIGANDAKFMPKAPHKTGQVTVSDGIGSETYEFDYYVIDVIERNYSYDKNDTSPKR